ncbi:hypothetical protein LINPERHAP1_LOCUS24915 [Linum perenne]
MEWSVGVRGLTTMGVNESFVGVRWIGGVKIRKQGIEIWIYADFNSAEFA